VNEKVPFYSIKDYGFLNGEMTAGFSRKAVSHGFEWLFS
jgi:hypothetical protein